MSQTVTDQKRMHATLSIYGDNRHSESTFGFHSENESMIQQKVLEMQPTRATQHNVSSTFISQNQQQIFTERDCVRAGSSSFSSSSPIYQYLNPLMDQESGCLRYQPTGYSRHQEPVCPTHQQPDASTNQQTEYSTYQNPGCSTLQQPECSTLPQPGCSKIQQPGY